MKTAILSEEPRREPDFEEDNSQVRVRVPRRLQAGAQIGGKYLIRSVLGMGGFAVVYDAEHLGLRRSVAIKVLHVEPETPLLLVERFRNEARISALVRHPNVLEVYDTGTLDDGSPYLVMERIDGGTLYQRIAQGRLPVDCVVDFARQILLALTALCDRDIVHRDIKPENIMLHMDSDGSIVLKVVDFGISKILTPELELRLTNRGCLLGTPQYMSPEQIRGEDIDVRTDIYAVGVIMYEALTGCRPHKGTSVNELVLSRLNDQPLAIRELNPECPCELERIAQRALARDRKERYASPREMLQELARFVGSPMLEEYARRDSAAALLGAPTLHTGAAAGNKSAEASVCLPKPRPRAVSTFVVLAMLGLCTLEPSAVSPGSDVMEADASAARRKPHATSQSSDAHARMASTRPELAVPNLRANEASVEPVVVVQPLPSTDDPAELGRSGRHRDRAHSERRSHTTRLASTPGSPHERAPAEVRATPRSVRSEVVVPAPVAARATAVEASTDPALLRDALAAYVLGRLPRAETLYQQAVRRFPQDPTAWRGLGLVAARTGHVAEANRALKRYLELAPASPDAASIRSRLAALQ